MKGNPRIVAELNSLLTEELAAVNQYIVHAEMAENWGYESFAAYVKRRAVEEMRHAERLIAHILFLEGSPAVQKPAAILIGVDLPAGIGNDLKAEYSAVEHYNRAIRLAAEMPESDSGTAELLRSIEAEEERHIDLLEGYRTQIAQMGLPQFLMLAAAKAD